MNEARFYVYGDKAYRSGIALFRAERATAEECEIALAPMDSTFLFRIETEDCPEIITHNYGQVQEVVSSAMRGEMRMTSIVQVDVV